MTQEEKSLLLKDLCARLPYGVQCSCTWSHEVPNGTVEGDTVYVREDVFIKKAEKFIYSALNDGIMGTANIEDFMRLFKKYMED